MRVALLLAMPATVAACAPDVPSVTKRLTGAESGLTARCMGAMIAMPAAFPRAEGDRIFDRLETAREAEILAERGAPRPTAEDPTDGYARAYYEALRSGQMTADAALHDLGLCRAVAGRGATP